MEPVSTPKGLTATLRNYQLQGVSYLNFLSEYGFGGILADEMGLGKTIQTLSFIQHMVNHGHEGPNLIVVPTSVLPNWERESEKFVPHLKRLIIYGTRREGMFPRFHRITLFLEEFGHAPAHAKTDIHLPDVHVAVQRQQIRRLPLPVVQPPDASGGTGKDNENHNDALQHGCLRHEESE